LVDDASGRMTANCLFVSRRFWDRGQEVMTLVSGNWETLYKAIDRVHVSLYSNHYRNKDISAEMRLDSYCRVDSGPPRSILIRSATRLGIL